MIETSCPETRRVNNRRNLHKKWWQSPEWKALVKRETEGKCCEECGKKAGDIRTNAAGKSHVVKLTLDHPDRWAYTSFEIYIAAETPKKVVCNDCNRGFEKGLKICPVCRERYCHWRSEMCRSCYLERHPDLLPRLEAAQVQKKKDRSNREKLKRQKIAREKHPCKWRGLNQRCNRRRGLICDFPAKKAIGCLNLKLKVPKTAEAV